MINYDSNDDNDDDVVLNNTFSIYNKKSSLLSIVSSNKCHKPSTGIRTIKVKNGQQEHSYHIQGGVPQTKNINTQSKEEKKPFCRK